MASDLVGLEAIPNTYISKITINKGPHGSYYGEAHVYTRDLVGEDGPMWSGSPSILERLRFMFMSVEGEDNIRPIASGFYNLNDLMKLKSKNNKVINQINTQYKDVKTCKRFSMGTDIYYKNIFKFKIKPNTLDQAVFCCLYMKAPMVSGKNSVVDQYTMNLKGPSTSEYILKEGNISFTSNIFIKENGQQWPGPVHYHQGTGYMEGASHSEESHGNVRRQTVPNLKIINNINFRFLPKTIANKPRYSPVTKLWSTFTHGGSVSGVFGVNYKNILIRKTKYGHSLMNLQTADLLSLINKMKINLLGIKRYKIKTLKNKKTKVLQSKRLVSSFTDDFGDFKESIVISKNNGPDITIRMEDLRSSSGLEVVNPSEIFLEDLETSQIKSAVKEIPLNLGQTEAMKFYQFEDQEITTESFGKFSYELTVRFKDPTIKYVDNMISEARDGLSSLKNYLTRILSENNYDYNMDSLKQSFIDKERELYINDLSFAPWIRVVKNYCKYLGFIYELNENQIEFLLNTNFPKVHPKTATLTSIKMFVNEYEKITNKLYKHFDVSTAKLTSNRSSDNLTSFKEPNTNTISIIHEFRKILNTQDAKTFYNYFSHSGGDTGAGMFSDSQADEILFISKSALMTRFSAERNKFQTNQPAMKIVSPLSVQRGKHIITINKDLFDEEYIRQLNLFFNNIILQEIPQDPIVVEEVPAEPEPPSLNIHIPSQEILGEDTKFSVVESQDDLCMRQFSSKTPESFAQHAAIQAAAGSPQAMPSSLVAAFVLASGGAEPPPMLAQSEWVGKPEQIINVLVNHHMIHKVEVLDGFIEGYLENWRDITDNDLASPRELLCRIKHIGPGWPPAGSILEKATKLPTSVNKYFFLTRADNGLSDAPIPVTNTTTRDAYSNSIISLLQYDPHLSTSNIIKQNIKIEESKSSFVVPEDLNEEDDINDIPRYATNIIRSFEATDAAGDTTSIPAMNYADPVQYETSTGPSGAPATLTEGMPVGGEASAGGTVVGTGGGGGMGGGGTGGGY